MASIGRLAWQTSTGALLWEIWGRRKWHFAWHSAALLAGYVCAHYKEQSASEMVSAVLCMVSLTCFFASYLHLLTCFGYIEADSKKVQIGFPARLFLKPVSTAQLVLVPMFFGGAAVVTVLMLWSQFVLRPLGWSGPLVAPWISAIALSFFWWMQALSWSLPLLQARALVMLFVSVIHLLVAVMPLAATPIAAGWRWSIIAALLVSAVLTALTGLRWMRRGTWEGPSRFSVLCKALRPARNLLKAARFSSAFHAQFWLEWRTFGSMLPAIVGGIGLVIVPLIYLLQKNEQSEDFEMIVVTLMLVIPLMLSGVMATAIAKFDLQPSAELPIYIAIRPMTTGGLVIAKLAMALATSALTWVVGVTVSCFWLWILGRAAFWSKVQAISGYGVGAIAVGCLPLLILLILFTWRNLLGGIAAGLTGRTWVNGVFSIWRCGCFIGLATVFFAAKTNVHFHSTLSNWLPWILLMCLVWKIAIAISAFAVGLPPKCDNRRSDSIDRRRLVSVRDISGCLLSLGLQRNEQAESLHLHYPRRVPLLAAG